VVPGSPLLSLFLPSLNVFAFSGIRFFPDDGSLDVYARSIYSLKGFLNPRPSTPLLSLNVAPFRGRPSGGGRTGHHKLTHNTNPKPYRPHKKVSPIPSGTIVAPVFLRGSILDSLTARDNTGKMWN